MEQLEPNLENTNRWRALSGADLKSQAAFTDALKYIASYGAPVDPGNPAFGQYVAANGQVIVTVKIGTYECWASDLALAPTEVLDDMLRLGVFKTDKTVVPYSRPKPPTPPVTPPPPIVQPLNPVGSSPDGVHFENLRNDTKIGDVYEKDPRGKFVAKGANTPFGPLNLHWELVESTPASTATTPATSSPVNNAVILQALASLTRDQLVDLFIQIIKLKA